jgi:DNA mismatch endonuclease, patch repair protein
VTIDTLPEASWASALAVRRSMVANRHRDTTPEVRLRSLLHAAGVRFRKDYRIDIDGLRIRTDIAFPGSRVAVFVDGCFWHRCPLHGTDPKRNGDFWKRKLDRNVERDHLVNATLSDSDWTVLRFWEHIPTPEAAEHILTHLAGEPAA